MVEREPGAPGDVGPGDVATGGSAPGNTAVHQIVNSCPGWTTRHGDDTALRDDTALQDRAQQHGHAQSVESDMMRGNRECLIVGQPHVQNPHRRRPAQGKGAGAQTCERIPEVSIIMTAGCNDRNIGDVRE